MLKTFPVGKVFFISIFLFVVIPFLVISCYNHPAADDFCFSYRAIEVGFWNAQKHWYTVWTGRYFSSAMLSVGPMVNKSILQYKVMPVILIAMLFFSFYALFRQILIFMSGKKALFAAGILLLIFMAGVPSIVEGIYWMPGYVTYTYGTFLFLFLLAALLRLYREERKVYKRWLFVLCSLFILAVVGSNETIMLLLVLLLIFVNGYIFWRTKKINPWFAAFLGIAILASVVVIVSPGNALRMGNHPKGGNFFYAIFHAIFDTVYHSVTWLSSGVLLIFTIFFIPIAASIHRKFAQDLKYLYIHPFIGLLLFAILVSTSFFPAYWSVGGPPPPRTLNVIYIVFLLGWFYNIYLILGYLLRPAAAYDLSLPRFVIPILCIMLVYSLVDEGNVRKVYADLLKGRASRYDQAMLARQELVRTSKEQTIILPALKSPPETIFFDDITTDGNHWKNYCYSRYIKKDSVVIQEY